MTILISIIWFLIVIAVLILAHEFGHFITAKASGIIVEEFGLGFPPKLFSIKRGETVYSINAIPLGGFTKMAGEEDATVPRSLASKGKATRVLVLAAGSIMNFLLPLLLFAIAFMVPHNVVIGKVVVEAVSQNSPAAVAGIEPGDIILSVNGNPLGSSADLRRYVRLNLGNEITLVIQHPDSTKETVKMIPRWKPPAGQGAVGIGSNTTDAITTSQSEPFWRAIPMSVVSCVETFVLFKNEIISMIIGSTPLTISGPVGIAQLTGEVARTGISPLLEFAAFLSINLAIVNLLPIPGLDGGRIVFVFLEWVLRGRRISAKTEGTIHLIGYALLIALILLVTYQDIIRIISGESLIP
ncbi:MAG: RIP metalloprotease RseP [Chloroflexota bacterium]